MNPDDIIMAFVPEIGTALHNGSTIFVYPEEEIAEDLVAIPDFTGKNYNECMIAAENAGIIVQFEGDFAGLAISQSVASKEKVKMINPDQTDPDKTDQDGIDVETTDLNETISSETDQTELNEIDEASELQNDEVTEDVSENNQGEDKMTDEDQKINYVQRGSIIKVLLGSASSE